MKFSHRKMYENLRCIRYEFLWCSLESTYIATHFQGIARNHSQSTNIKVTHMYVLAFAKSRHELDKMTLQCSAISTAKISQVPNIVLGLAQSLSIGEISKGLSLSLN